MRHNKLPEIRNPIPASTTKPIAAAASDVEPNRFCAPTGRGGQEGLLHYVNQVSLPGHDVQHWLEAEAHLIAERNLTRGFTAFITAGGIT